MIRLENLKYHEKYITQESKTLTVGSSEKALAFSYRVATKYSNHKYSMAEAGIPDVKKKACNAHQIWCATFVPSGTPYMA